VLKPSRTRNEDRRRTWARLFGVSPLLVLLSSCVLITSNFNPFQETRQPLQEKTVEGKGRDKILIIDISEVITGEEHEGALGRGARESTVARVKEELKKAQDDSRVRGVILRIDSPGGGVTASDVIYREIVAFKEAKGAPVVASLMDVAASGGYYVALSADEIIAHPTTVTGSIGVLMMNLNVAELFDKIGVDDTTVTSGIHKDIGSPFRKPTASDREILQSVVNSMYARFLERVRDNRKEIPEASMKTMTDGRIMTAQQALEGGFIDRIGYVEDAITATKQRAGISEAKVVVYHRPDEYAENIYSMQGMAPPSPRLSQEWIIRLLSGSGPRFLYLWAPGVQ
jgi:protease-4